MAFKTFEIEIINPIAIKLLDGLKELGLIRTFRKYEVIKRPSISFVIVWIEQQKLSDNLDIIILKLCDPETFKVLKFEADGMFSECVATDVEEIKIFEQDFSKYKNNFKIDHETNVGVYEGTELVGIVTEDNQVWLTSEINNFLKKLESCFRSERLAKALSQNKSKE